MCQGTPTAKAFDKVFGGVIVDGRFNGAAIAGKVIFYLLDPNGVFKSFLPIDQATPEEIEEFEKSRKEANPPPKGRHINEGLAKPDDPIYLLGPVVNGRPLFPPKESGTGRVIMVGSLPPDHPIYSRGPMIFGRPDPPKKKPTDN